MSQVLPNHKSGSSSVGIYLIPVAVYLVATLLSDAYFMGDTPGYTTSILAYEHGGSFNWDNAFWEFGHLLWRPLGHLAFHLFSPITTRVVGGDERLQLTLSLMFLSWLSGLFSVVFLRRLLGQFVESWIANVIVVGACFSNAFLNYAQTGCSYVTGLLLLIVGLTLLVETRAQDRLVYKQLIAGAACLAGSVCMWFPFVLVLPAALVTPVVLGRSFRMGVPATLRATLFTAILLGLAYIAVLVHLRIFTLEALRTWMLAAGHGYNQTGIPRMVFGLARSFVNMGDDGILFKRYLLHDPYSPVTLIQLVRFSLWKLLAFYLALGTVGIVTLCSDKGRRVIAIVLVAALPILYFALFVFEGGMPERYLPLWPFLFLLFAISMGSFSLRIVRYVVIAFVGVMIISNFGAMSKWTLQRKQELIKPRISELYGRLKPNSLIAATHLQDELTSFYYNYPFNPLNRHGDVTVYNVLEPGAARILTWREDFAAKVGVTWRNDGDLWISKRFFASRPRPEWNWTEGDDRRVSWPMLPAFFSQFEVADSLGGEDGFVLLARTPANEKRIMELAVESTIRE